MAETIYKRLTTLTREEKSDANPLKHKPQTTTVKFFEIVTDIKRI